MVRNLGRNLFPVFRLALDAEHLDRRAIINIINFSMGKGVRPRKTPVRVHPFHSLSGKTKTGPDKTFRPTIGTTFSMDFDVSIKKFVEQVRHLATDNDFKDDLNNTVMVGLLEGLKN